MSRDIVNKICATYFGAESWDPWGGGHDVWKVGDKMFASIGARGDGVSVKTESWETAQMLIDANVGEKARYLDRRWVRWPLTTSVDELSHRLRAPYDLIFQTLTKKKQQEIASK